MKLYCLRHGETTYNLAGLCNDDPRDPAFLTNRGIRQAEAAAERLRAVALERIFASELPRTQQTASIVNRHHGLAVTVNPDLNDIRSGFNNRTVSEYFAATAHDPLHACINGGESLIDHRQRVVRFLEWILAQPLGNVLIVAHEETLRVFAAYSRGLPDSALRDLSFANGELLELEFHGRDQPPPVAA